jgi:hypothetical protein
MLRLACVASLAILFATSAVAADAPDSLEIWLARADQCNSCVLYAKAAKRRGYGSTLRYEHGDQVFEIPIKNVRKDELRTEVLKQLRVGTGPDNPDWSVQLSVLVVRDGKVLHNGNIAESADLGQVRYSQDQMFPPAHPGKGHASVRWIESPYATFFTANWNLEYFVAVALGERAPRVSRPVVDLDSPKPAALGRWNVILWGAADTPMANGLFTARRLNEIRPIVESQIPASEELKVITLFGHGPASDGNDTSVMEDRRIGFIRADVRADYGADAESLGAVLTAVRHSSGTRNLLIHAGHAGPTGAPLWGQPGALSADDLARVGSSPEHELVMISGGCHSGIFAHSVSCGFFAAHPEVVASGCQLSQSAIEQSDDYLKLFFKSYGAKESSEADRSGDGKVSFSEAHWYASARVEDHQLSYTTVDGLADAYFDAFPSKLPGVVSLSQIVELASHATAEEGAALERMTAGLNPALRVSLDDAVARNHAALSKLERAGELSSAERNAIISLPYKLMLPMLARRLLYKSLEGKKLAVKRVAACEAQTLSGFGGSVSE